MFCVLVFDPYLWAMFFLLLDDPYFWGMCVFLGDPYLWDNFVSTFYGVVILMGTAVLCMTNSIF